jgi:hypothetical protein
MDATGRRGDPPSGRSSQAEDGFLVHPFFAPHDDRLDCVMCWYDLGLGPPEVTDDRYIEPEAYVDGADASALHLHRVCMCIWINTGHASCSHDRPWLEPSFRGQSMDKHRGRAKTFPGDS